LNIDLDISNKRQNCKIGTVFGGVTSGRGRVNEEDEGEGVCLMYIMYLYEIEQRILLQLL
jgi:hypothetical protein